MKSDPLGLLAELKDGDLTIGPLAESHREPLREACAEDEAIWEIYASSYDREHFDASFDNLLVNPTRLPMAIMVDGQLAGMTCWINTDAHHRTTEIGNTYLRPKFRGGAVNGRMKKLLFSHGFARGLKRMQLTVDTRNERSKAACLKVGATFEGVIRNQYITWTGYLRDSAVFSVVERDRERLGL